MDLSKPYSAVCPSLDGPVLKVLYGTTRPLTGAEVARLAGKGSPRGVRLVLDRMASHGLVSKDAAGTAWLYSLNRRHLAFESVKALMNLRSRLFDEMRDLISSWPVQPYHVSVFGSAARGDGDVNSDIDIFVVREAGVAEEASNWRSQLAMFGDEMHVRTGNRVSFSEVSRQELRRMLRDRPPIVEALANESMPLAGNHFRNLGIDDMRRSAS